MNVCPYWNEEDNVHAQKVGSFRELGSLLVEMLRRVPPEHRPLHMVIAALTSPGTGDEMANRLKLRFSIEELRGIGMAMFDQTVLELHHRRLTAKWRSRPGNERRWCYPILRDVIIPAFDTGVIGHLHDLPHEGFSVGKWVERHQGEKRGFRISSYPHRLYQRVLCRFKEHELRMNV